jgi:3-hydroxyisobutyrate dehydrogenase-like beta-hydroxyacid dehydrogenase
LNHFFHKVHPMQPVQNITLLGCGLMGLPMSKRILAAGFPLTVWNRTRAKAQMLAELGAKVADTPEQAVAQADLVITMLEHGGVVSSVLFDADLPGAASGMRPGTLLVDMSSILPEQAREHALRLENQGVNALDAPVSGGTVGKVWKCSGSCTSLTAFHSGSHIGCHIGSMSHEQLSSRPRMPILATR